MKNVLVFAAHPDDELLGLGGTVRRLANEGAVVRAVIMAEGLTSRSEVRSISEKGLEELKECAKKAASILGYKSIDFCELPDNRMDGMELLDVIKFIDRYIEKYNPDTIFTHHHGDLNIDHRITNEAVLTACRPDGKCKVKRIYSFETPSSSEWAFNYAEPFTPNVFFDVTKTFDSKIEGLKQYISEIRDYPHPRSVEGVKSLEKLRGTNARFEMAEGFVLLRECN